MLKLSIVFTCCLLLSSAVTAQENSTNYTQIDSVYVSKVVRLLNDYKACNELTDSLKARINECDMLVDRMRYERDEYAYIVDQYDSMLKEINERNTTLERKLTRTRKIGVIGTIGGLILGVLAVLII